MSTGAKRFHILLLADESADWMVAGLRQLDRLILSIDEFAVENKGTVPVLVCILWQPDLDHSQRWVPKNERLTQIAFTTGVGDQPFDLVLNTRMFFYRKAMSRWVATAISPPEIISSSEEAEFWKSNFPQVESLARARQGPWEYIANGNQIDAIEIRFLRASGKSQDGLVSRYLNRPISRVVTRLLLRFPTTPNAWTWLIFPIPIVGALIMLQGTFAAFVVALLLFQVFSILDGCDGEIARAKFLESERGRQLDDLFDVLSNILLVLGLGFGLSRQVHLTGGAGWFFAIEGIAAGVLIGLNEFYLSTREEDANGGGSESLGGALYPRHRKLVERSGLLFLGETFASWLIQLTKRDVAMLFFVFLAAVGLPAWILHLLLLVTAASFLLAWRARSAR